MRRAGGAVAREYGGSLATRSFGGALVGRTFYARDRPASNCTAPTRR